MNTMSYKSFVAKIEFDNDINLFCGTVVNSAPHTFYGDSVETLQKEFSDTIDEYLKICEEKGQNPRKTYSGKLHLRMQPELHTQAALKSAEEGCSVNAWIVHAIERAVA